MSETSVKLFQATKMNCAVVSALISIAFVSQAFAVLRPLFPVKPEPPFSGEVIIIGGDSVTVIQIVRPLESIAETQPQLYLGLRRFSMMIFQCIAADECRCFFFSTDDGDNSIPSAIASLTVPSRDASHLAITERHSASRRMSRAGCAQTTVQIRKEVRKDEG
jgi:hypothetical protein